MKEEEEEEEAKISERHSWPINNNKPNGITQFGRTEPASAARSVQLRYIPPKSFAVSDKSYTASTDKSKRKHDKSFCTSRASFYRTTCKCNHRRHFSARNSIGSATTNAVVWIGTAATTGEYFDSICHNSKRSCKATTGRPKRTTGAETTRKVSNVVVDHRTSTPNEGPFETVERLCNGIEI